MRSIVKHFPLGRISVLRTDLSRRGQMKSVTFLFFLFLQATPTWACFDEIHRFSYAGCYSRVKFYVKVIRAVRIKEIMFISLRQR